MRKLFNNPIIFNCSTKRINCLEWKFIRIQSYSTVVQREHPWARKILQYSIILNCNTKRISLSDEDSKNSTVYNCSAKRILSDEDFLRMQVLWIVVQREYLWVRLHQNQIVLNYSTKRIPLSDEDSWRINRIELLSKRISLSEEHFSIIHSFMAMRA